MDLDPRLAPDIVADVARLGFADETFDCVLAAQVLEHIPFEEFKTALCELARVTRRYVVITLPAPLVGVAAVINTPLFPELGFVTGFPYWIKHRFNGQHYWEVGKRGFSLRRISEEINSSGLNIINRFRPAPSLYSCFFVARKC